MLKMKKAIRKLKSEKGMATIETIPLILLFIFLVTYMIGFFGVIHTGILSSISARAYAFEIFRNRTNLTYFSGDDPGRGTQVYTNQGNRIHGIQGENTTASAGMHAQSRPIRIGSTPAEPIGNTSDIHNTQVYNQTLIGPEKRNTSVEVNPVWVMVQYGICMNANCGGS
jgi:hypothetical protein